MIIEVEVHGDPIAVDVRTGSNGTVAIGGREIQCNCVRLPDGGYSIILEGRVFDVSTYLNGESCVVSTREGQVTLGVRDPRRLGAGNRSEAGPTGLQRLVADMPGKVVRILVSIGDTVEIGQGLLVVEAMKMQNEIRSPKRGVVREVGVLEGKTVNAGEFLISLE